VRILRNAGRSVTDAAPAFGAVVLLLVAWQVGATLASTLWFPTFTTVIQRILDLLAAGEIQDALVSSFVTLVAGCVLAAIVGVATGVAMGVSRRVDLALRIYVDALLFVPPVVLAPVFFLFFGLSSWTLVAVVFTFAVFVIISNTVTAIAGTDEGIMDMATSFGASPTERLRDVILPSALPLIFSGLQLGMGRAVKGMIVGEIIIAVVGLGYLDRQFSNSFDAPGIWAIALTVIGMALILTTLVRAVDRVVNRWAD
jgi:NitT/TauT family transport system permease protein